MQDSLEEVIYGKGCKGYIGYKGLFRYRRFGEYMDRWKDTKLISKSGDVSHLERIYHIVQFNVVVHYEARKERWARVKLTGNEDDRMVVRRKILKDAKIDRK